MSLATIKTFQKLCTGNNPILYAAWRNAGHWNKDYKPSKVPETAAEHAAAAKKYELHPSDYQPEPNDGVGKGDYPDLPWISGDAKDPFYPWDNPELKRNFNEPMHAEFDVIGEDRYDVSAKHRISVFNQLLQFVGVVGGLFAIFYAMEDCKQFAGLAPKQYPHKGVTHYEFEQD